MNEYGARKRLTELGYTFDAKDLSADKAEAFLYISSVIDEYQNEQMKKQRR